MSVRYARTVTTRVLWVVKGLGPGGAERLLVELAAGGLARRADIECAFVVPWKDHHVGDLARHGVHSVCLGGAPRRWMWPWRLVQLVRRGAYDVVHIHAPLPGAVARAAARTLPRSRRPRVVTTEHNAWTTYHPLTRWLNRITAQRDEATIAVSSETAESLRGASRRRSDVVRHGIDVPGLVGLRARRGELRDRLGVDDHHHLIVTVANYRPQKDHHTLLSAAAILRDRGHSFQWLAVGQGPLAHELTRRRDELGLHGVVDICGYRDDAREVLAAADQFVLSSRYEGLPVAAMEAAALGVPMVSTAVGGVAEQWTDGVDALLVPPGDAAALADAVERMLTDVPVRAQIAEATGRLSAVFALDPVVDKLAAEYRLDAESTAADGPTRSAARHRDAPDIRPATLDDREQIIDVLWRSMGSPPDQRHADLFAWKHDHNPFGASPVWVVEHGGAIVGVRAMMRWQFERDGRRLMAVRAVDTATAPEAQGRGLFTALTMHALADLAGTTDFVFNTPNDNSRPGYVKMGWQVVGRLPAAVVPVGAVGLGRLVRSRQPAELWSEPVEIGMDPDEWITSQWRGDVQRGRPRALVTAQSETYWRWRLGLASLHYRIVDDGEVSLAIRVRRRGPSRELVVAHAFGDSGSVDVAARRVASAVGCDYALRLGRGRVPHSLSMPGGGPLLTWRALREPGMPPLDNWHLTMADIELF